MIKIILGAVGVLLLPFLAYGDGIFWIGDQPTPWIQLGANLGSLLAIIAWAGAHSCIIFGGLYYFDKLRIDTDTESLGCDITKHGESAYPVTAWKEAQYDVATSNMGKSLPPHMAHNQMYTISGSLEPNTTDSNSPVNGGIDNIAMEKFD